MNKHNAKEFLPLVKALAEGKTIQHFSDIEDRWVDTTTLSSMDPPSKYRIKPELRDIWVNEYEAGMVTAYDSKELAHKYCSKLNAVRCAVHYREVIDEE